MVRLLVLVMENDYADANDDQALIRDIFSNILAMTDLARRKYLSTNGAY
jgi:hypothetical protein